MKEIIKKYKLKQTDLFTWENENYILQMKPTDILLALLTYNCIIKIPNMYPEYKDFYKKYKNQFITPKILENNNDLVLIHIHTKSFREFENLIKGDKND